MAAVLDYADVGKRPHYSSAMLTDIDNKAVAFGIPFIAIFYKR
jgi:hypothetical protein